MILKDKDLRIHFYKSSGPGGQRKNKKETAVKITHIPTGVTVVATESRLQSHNKELALMRLKKKLDFLFKKYKKRIPTRASLGAKEEMLHAKKIKSQKKALRRKFSESFLEY